MVRLTALAIAFLLTTAAAQAAPRDPRGAGEAIARALVAKRQPQARLHTTDFAIERVGCILLPRKEMRRFGYPGHAFACEEVGEGQVLGAVLNSRGRSLCEIVGAYAGDDCYALTICDVPETLCVH